MSDHDRLSSLILNHWSLYHPSMLAKFRQEGRLEKELKKTTDQFADLLYELVSVRKMEFHQAWELAVDQFLKPEPSSSKKSPGPHATSG